MDAAEKAQAVMTWMQSGQAGEYLKLNALVSDSGDLAILTSYADSVITEYIDGTAERQFTLTADGMLPYSDGNDGTNASSIGVMSGWMQWVVQMGKDKNYPDFGDAVVTGVETTYPAPVVAMVYDTDRVAKYTFDVTIFYRE